jgi:hypothetical protein
VHLVLQVWGTFYTDALVDFCIPALLSPRNLPALAGHFPCRFVIYTTPDDERTLRAAPILRRLEEVAEVRFVTIDWGRAENKYAAMTECNVRGLREAAASSAAVVFLVPDTVWSDGTLATVAAALNAGKRAVMQAGVRVEADSAIPALRRQFPAGATGVITATPRELVRIALDHMHPYFRTWFWDAPAFNRNSAYTFWRFDGGVVARCFHLHPLMLYCERPVFDFVSTLDDDLPILALPDFESLYIVQDSDEVFHIDLAHRDLLISFKTLPEGPSAAYLSEWARFRGNLYHRRFAQYPIRFHAGPLGRDWKTQERKSNAVYRRVRLRILLPGVRLRLLERLFAVPRTAVVDRAAATRLSWESMPPAPGWWRWMTTALSAAGATRVSASLDRRRRDIYSEVAQYIFGINVAGRALDLDVAAIKRARRGRKQAPPPRPRRRHRRAAWRTPRFRPAAARLRKRLAHTPSQLDRQLRLARKAARRIMSRLPRRAARSTRRSWTSVVRHARGAVSRLLTAASPWKSS